MPRPKNPANTHPGHPSNVHRHPFDHHRHARHHEGGGAPATVWAPPPSAVGPAWEPWLRRSIRAAFLPSAGRMLDLTAQAIHPSPTAEDPSRRDGEDDAILLDQAQVVSLTTHADSAGDGVDVVFVDLRDAQLDDRVDDRVGMLGRMALRRGGILAVLTRCHTSRPDTAATALAVASSVGNLEELVDPTGQIVAAAQNADLLYLQHIVIPTAPLLPPANPPVNTAAVTQPNDLDEGERPPQPSRPAPGRHGHALAHVDLLVFLSPRAPAPAPPELNSPPPITTAAAGEPARGAR